MNTIKDYATKYPYAVLGAGELVVERAKTWGRLGTEAARSTYADLVRRGEKVSAGLKKTQPRKRVIENAKQAQRQIKGAVTSVRKALGVEDQKPATSTKKAS